MSTRPHFTIAERLNAAKLAIANSLEEAEIQSLVSGYGYSPAKLGEGKALYEAALAAVSEQVAARGAQQLATSELEQAEIAARDAYQALAKVSRAVFQDDKPRLVALGLDHQMPDSTAGFIVTAFTLFDNAASAPVLPDFGYDSQRIKAEGAKIVAFEHADEKQEAAKGVAQQATQKSEAALDTLDAWRAKYVKIARVALRVHPQLLEKLGVLARTSKTAAQKEASNKRRAAKKESAV